jgi:WD40 repeat protein
MKYWAFLSYSHTDKKWGDWLHKVLETYRVPRRLVGKDSRDGKIPQRLFPIFRDREELPVSADLGSNINEALRESRYLIVICSPRSAQSRWVNEEIKTFKSFGREDRVLALIVGGEPNASDGKPGFTVEDECFPEPLRYRIVDGKLSEVRTEPIAADARQDKDGKQNAKLKLLAGLLGVNFDDLKQREQERRLRRARVIGAAALGLTAVFAGLAAWAVVSERQATAQKRQTQRVLAASDTTRARELFDRDDAGRALVFLARATEVDPDPRSVAAERLWFALTQRSWPLPVSAQMRHKEGILSACFSPDGSKIVTGSRDKTARLWNATSGKELTPPLKHPRLVRRALFISGGRYVLTTCFDGVARLWEAGSGKQVPNWQLENPDSINSVAVSERGRYIATGSGEGTIRVWDAVSAKFVAEFHQPENVHTLFFQPSDETMLLSVSGKVAALWKIPNPVPIFEFHHGDQVNSAEFSPKGDQVLTASSDGNCYLWDASTGKMIGEKLAHDGEVTNALFSPNGELAATIVRDRLFIWELNGGKPIVKYYFEHKSAVSCACFSRDGMVVFTGTSDGTAQGWNLLTGRRLGQPVEEDTPIITIDVDPKGKRLLIVTANNAARVWLPPARFPIANRLGQGGGIESISISSDKGLVATGSDDGTARLWDLKSGKPVANPLNHKPAVLCTAFSPDGKYVVTGGADDTARIWSTSSGRLAGDPLSHDASVCKVAVSPNGKLLATATESGKAQLWDLASERPVGNPMVHEGRITAMEFNRDGSLLLTAGWDFRARIWHSQTGEPAGAPFQAKTELTCAHFSPGGDVVAAGSRDGIVYLWPISGGGRVRQLIHKRAVTDLAFSPDGRRLVTGSQDKTAAVWDAATGRSLCDPIRRGSAVSAVAFSPDSLRIVVACEDGTVGLWDAATGQPVSEVMTHQKAVRSVLFSPDGATLLTGSEDGTVRLWDVRAQLTRSDRKQLAELARAISPRVLRDSGRVDAHFVEPKEALARNTASFTGSARRLSNWFFADPWKRPLTPFATVNLADYVKNCLRENSDASRAEARYLSPEISGAAR